MLSSGCCCSMQQLVNICQVLWDLQGGNSAETPRLGLICCICLSSCTWGVRIAAEIEVSASLHLTSCTASIFSHKAYIWYESSTWPEAFTLVESRTLKLVWGVSCLSSLSSVLLNITLCSHFPLSLLREPLFQSRVLRLCPNSGMLITDSGILAGKEKRI